jgi:hypothetical protein
MPLDRVVAGKRTLFDVPNSADSAGSEAVVKKKKKTSKQEGNKTAVVADRPFDLREFLVLNINTILFALIGICIAILVQLHNPI